MRQGVPAVGRHSSEMPQSGCHGGKVPKSIIGRSRENVTDGIEASRQRLNVLARRGSRLAEPIGIKWSQYLSGSPSPRVRGGSSTKLLGRCRCPIDGILRNAKLRRVPLPRSVQTLVQRFDVLRVEVEHLAHDMVRSAP